MAWRFKQEYVRDGDVVEPSELRINLNETVSELNGFLDSDNIERDSIYSLTTKRGAFTEVFTQSEFPSRCYVFDHTESGWITETGGTGNEEWYTTTFAKEPANTPAYRNIKTALQPLPIFPLPQLKFQSDQDGLLIVEFCGFVQWMDTNTNTDTLNTTDISGTPGSQTERSLSLAKYGFYARQGKYFKYLNALVLCSMWRITVNGQVVAETGPLGNEYRAHPIYMCGAIPVLKERENIVQLEAQFVWYSPAKDQYLQASGFSPLVKESTESVMRAFGNNIGFRTDCSLVSANMVAIYRKR